MNKWFYFLGGLVVGVVLALVCCAFFNRDTTNISEPTAETKNEENTIEQQREKLKEQGFTLFDEVGDIVNEKSVEVFQVIANDAALVRGEGDYGNYTGTVYLIVNGAGKYYYDDEIIEISNDQEFRQVGIYRYETQNGYKTVPIIGRYDKDSVVKDHGDK